MKNPNVLAANAADDRSLASFPDAISSPFRHSVPGKDFRLWKVWQQGTGGGGLRHKVNSSLLHFSRPR